MGWRAWPVPPNHGDTDPSRGLVLIALKLALACAGVAAFLGGCVGALMIAAARRGAASGVLAAGPAAGGFVLGAHAAAVAALWDAPTIGACLAAALGAGWVGAAAAALTNALLVRPFRPRRAGAALAMAVLGAAHLFPLWVYVAIMRMHAMNL